MELWLSSTLQNSCEILAIVVVDYSDNINPDFFWL